MVNLVLIAGSSHGGWGFDPVADRLRALGHKVFAPSLTGLDHQKQHSGVINLDTHIQDVLDLIDDNNLDEVLLVGHSYGGMVITGVADRTNAKVLGMVYLDAMLPAPGQRLWDMMDSELQSSFLAGSHDGLYIYPDEGFKAFRPRVMPHPLATMLQPLNYSEGIFDTPVKVYVYAEKFFGVPQQVSPFLSIYQRLAAKSDWDTHSLPFGHDIVEEAPDQIFEIIASAAARAV